MKKITSTAIAMIFLATLNTGFVFAQNPTCSNVTGVWQNDYPTDKSTMTITNFDSATGKITGTYVSGNIKGSLQGWINDESVAGSGTNKVDKVISFTVKWDVGSITSWTGYCITESSKPVIKAQWHLVRPRTNFSWDHILTGNDTYNPE